MAKRATKKVPKAIGSAPNLDYLSAALKKQTKDHLIDLLLEIAKRDRSLQTRLEKKFGVSTPDDQLVSQTRQAISDATSFDESEMNRNFDYDCAAYALVKKNFQRLAQLGRWDEVMRLALELMKDGSYQVEMSDEGMMTEDIEACMLPVIDSLKQADLPRDTVLTWCESMTQADKVGFISDRQLASLRKLWAKH